MTPIRRAAILITITASLVACSSGQPTPEPAGDRQLELLQRSARTAYETGQPQTAVNLYQQALNRAMLRADSNAIADTSFNLAAARARIRNYEAALKTLRDTDPLTPPDTQPRRRLLAAQIHFEQEDLDAAERALDDAGAQQNTSPLVRIYRGLIAAKRGNINDARKGLNQLASPDPAAPRNRLIGLIAENEGDFDAAARAYEREARAHRDRGNYAATAEALARAANAYAQAGDNIEAARAYRLAAHSARQQKAELSHERWLQRAEKLTADPP